MTWTASPISANPSRTLAAAFQTSALRCGQRDLHVGQHPQNRLELGDEAAELLAPLDVGDGEVEGALSDAQRHRRDAAAL